ncbi:SCP2 sterol-binding domain-containing protein [Lysobacter sp. A6]|uniref:Ubiquinone biosynthesis accessory factor UbiJ n=1 Tax=Noviluteimonas lactosilytica TaxID=2888523 RepID=A0ABS8JHX5_9GAMM|nr:SCP2 sterol-binding domain-containing protein [Lysobacter lactosilyticus]MCC8363201.1 SCP2 sterol-binding domain-containing protein [Lysobacter lactosilyticus]
MSASSSAGSPLNWRVHAGRVLEAALNRALALDPDTRASLRALDGRRIQLAVESPQLAAEIRVEGERLAVGPADANNEPDLGVRGTLGGLIAQLPFFKRDDAPPVGRVRVSGDADLARRLQRMAERFDPDWQQPFVNVFGEVVGVQIAKGVAAALREAKVAGASVAGSAAEYVTEESRDVVAKDEVHAFCDDVDALRDDVERLAVRVQRLQSRGGRA